MSTPLIPIFQTDLSEVHALLNLDVGTNLAAIGNKLYLIYCGEITPNPTTTTTITAIGDITTTTTTIDKSVILTYPNGGEFLEIGSEITIAWSSAKGVNDAVQIDLYKGTELNSSINPKTSNDGTYAWTIPSTIGIGEDYKIKITWLSAGTASESDSDMSDGVFSIGYSAPVTTTTTTTVLDPTQPDISSCRGIPIPTTAYIGLCGV